MDNEISKRTKVIRDATPDCLEELFEMSNRKCDLCGYFIQDLILAELEHSTPVSHFAKNLELSIKDAVQQAHDSSNLRVAHYACNSAKGGRTREEWFAKGLNKKVGEPKILTNEELSSFRFRIGAGGRAAGPITGSKLFENKKGIFNPDYDKSLAGLKANKLHPNLAHNNGINSRDRKIGIFSKETNLSLAGKEGGQTIRDNKLGIFSDDFDKGKGGRVAGPIVGRRMKEEKKGIFARTPKKMSADGRKGGLKHSESGHCARISGLGNHTHWHVNRGIVNPNCSFCNKN